MATKSNSTQWILQQSNIFNNSDNNSSLCLLYSKTTKKFKPIAIEALYGLNWWLVKYSNALNQAMLLYSNN